MNWNGKGKEEERQGEEKKMCLRGVSALRDTRCVLTIVYERVLTWASVLCNRERCREYAWVDRIVNEHKASAHREDSICSHYLRAVF